MGDPMVIPLLDQIPVGRYFQYSSIPTLGPTRPSIQWGPGLFRG